MIGIWLLRNRYRIYMKIPLVHKIRSVCHIVLKYISVTNSYFLYKCSKSEVHSFATAKGVSRSPMVDSPCDWTFKKWYVIQTKNSMLELQPAATSSCPLLSMIKINFGTPPIGMPLHHKRRSWSVSEYRKQFDSHGCRVLSDRRRVHWIHWGSTVVEIAWPDRRKMSP